MPRAEVGSTKYIANQMKSKGLQRLRWYCQACQRQMRDENGFKCHVASESHVRNMQLIGQDPRRAINDFSRQFERDFLQLLRTGHGEKKVNLNQFYQEYIANKEHVHMNATKWPSLTEFAKHLGRQGICRVDEDTEKEGRGGASALVISWIDNSPEALRRQEALRKKERQDKGDEEREQKMIEEQIRRARRDGLEADRGEEEDDDDDDADLDGRNDQGIRRKNGDKVVLNFSKKPTEPENRPPTPPPTDKSVWPGHDPPGPVRAEKSDSDAAQNIAQPPRPAIDPVSSKPAFKPLSLSTSKPRNVFAALSKKNALGPSKKPSPFLSSKPMSEAERIMKGELERKRRQESDAMGVPKKQRFP
ncbi:hypothetical protein DV737_g213, partial [Chaetothyriales sp. CBS 132003]